MKVLVNAASVKEGGPFVVLDQLMRWLPKLRDDIEWVVAANPGIRFGSDQKKFERIDAGSVEAGPFGVLHWYERALPAAVDRVKADLVFSVTNYLPLQALPVPTVLLVQHAGHFSPRFDTLMRRHLRRPDRVAAWMMKTRWVEQSVRAASEVTVQTVALAEAIAAKTARPRERIQVIPHGPGAVMRAPVARGASAGRPLRIGYITKWGVQKNFEVLLAAAAELAGQGRPLRIVLTLDERLAQNVGVIRRAAANGLAGMLENAGEIGADRISALYDSLDIFVFPSLVESFGFPLVEAMAKGLPVVAADTASNREVAGDAGRFFPPAASEALAAIVGAIADDASLREMLSAASIRRAQAFSWERAAEQTALLFDKVMSAAPSPRYRRRRW